MYFKNKKKWKIKFKWVKGYAGIYGNETADRLANKATQNHYVTYSKIPESAINRDPVRKYKKMAESMGETTKGAITKEFFQV